MPAVVTIVAAVVEDSGRGAQTCHHGIAQLHNLLAEAFLKIPIRVSDFRFSWAQDGIVNVGQDDTGVEGKQAGPSFNDSREAQYD